MPGVIVDGQDVLAVYDVAGEAVGRARSGDGPTFIEAKTYRFHGHCGAESDHAFPDECAEWRQRDPIELLKAKLAAADVAQVEAQVGEELDEAEAFAVSSPLPEANEVERFTF